MTLHKITSDIFPENPDIWARHLAEMIELEMLLMNLHLKGLSDNEFKLLGDSDFAGIPRLQNMTTIKRRELLETAVITNSFLSIFRNLVVFIDKTLALHLAASQSQKVPIGPIEDFQEFIENFPIEEYISISSNQRLNFPTKIKKLTSLPERTSQRLLAYNKLRVAFEHNDGIAKNDICFPISTFEREGKQTGYQKVIFRMDKPEIKEFLKGTKIHLKAHEVSLIAIDVKGWVIKDLLNAILKLT